MKKISLMLIVSIMTAVVACFAFAGVGYCADATATTIDCSSFPIANAGAAFVANISSSVSKGYIYRITVSKSDITVAQTVYFYHKVNSQTTATLLWQVYLDSGTGTTQYNAQFTDANPLTFERGLIVRKSAVGCDVRVNILAK